uniref:Splicing factor cactin central domain-containing protein n=1 Tax=Romanomermis culicivorax TaxID=13658 RepID=A0A915L2N2_ROMCU
GYTNVDNPFGDNKLLETFVWKKKLEKDGLSDLPATEVEQIARRKLEANKQELDKMRRRREEREAQKADIEMMMRDRESQQYAEWSKHEDKFHLQQAKLRSKIRIQEGRAKPIDLLSRCIDPSDGSDDFSIEMNEPYTYLKGLTIRDLEDLIEDIRVYRMLEGNKNSDYWDDVKVIADDELQKLKKYDPTSSDYVGDRRHGIHTSVMKDVIAILKGKTHHELALLETEIQKKMKQGGGVDVGYWETLLAQLKSHMAKARLRDRHEKMLKQRLLKMKEEQGIIDESASESQAPSTSKADPSSLDRQTSENIDEEEKVMIWE